jgi:23S rRNA (adenine2503-C2)-methyltransferase
VGDVPGIKKFAAETWQVRLAISLHAPNDELRSRLVPLNRKYPIQDLMEAIRYYMGRTGRQVSFEYVLLRGVNDSLGHARELAQLLKGMDIVINLIPYNRVPEAPFEPPSRKTAEAFRDQLLRANIKATLRQERGGDIDAACGQLRAGHIA